MFHGSFPYHFYCNLYQYNVTVIIALHCIVMVWTQKSTQQSFFYGGFALRSNSLFYAIFDRKGTPFIYISSIKE